MSDLSMIAHDYALNAEFARKFNEAVLQLKRLYLVGRESKQAQLDTDMEHCREELRQILTSLARALDDSGRKWSEEQAKVPTDVVDRLRGRVKSELPEAVSELQNTAKDLGEGLPLKEKAFAALDQVCEVADATASAAFRRLRRI